MPKVNTVHRVWLTIKRSNGTAAPGVDPGDVTITIRNPNDDASSVVAIVESALGGGLYRFDIPAAFSLAHGAGDYGILIDIDSNSPKVRDTSGGSVEYTLRGLDDLAIATVVATLNADIATTAAAIEATVDDILDYHANRLEIDFAVSPRLARLFERDGVTPKSTQTLETEGGEAVATSAGVQTKRGAAT